MTPFAYSKIPKGLLPLTHKAINYVFVSKNRSAAKNSTETIWENLKVLNPGCIQLQKVILSKHKTTTPEQPGHTPKSGLR